MEEYSGRDYFMVMESIFIRQNLQSGIIFIGEKHLYSKECSYKMLLQQKNNPSGCLKHFQDACRRGRELIIEKEYDVYNAAYSLSR